MQFYYKQVIPEYSFKRLSERGLIVNGMDGGLLIGKSHDYDGIPILMRGALGYEVIAEFEGYEYVMNPGATMFYVGAFDHLNDYDNDFKPGFQEYAVSRHVKTLDLRIDGPCEYDSKFLLLEPGCQLSIYNKHSTRLHLDRLNRMNTEVAYEWVPFKNTTSNLASNVASKSKKSLFRRLISLLTA